MLRQAVVVVAATLILKHWHARLRGAPAMSQSRCRSVCLSHDVCNRSDPDLIMLRVKWPLTRAMSRAVLRRFIRITNTNCERFDLVAKVHLDIRCHPL